MRTAHRIIASRDAASRPILSLPVVGHGFEDAPTRRIFLAIVVLHRVGIPILGFARVLDDGPQADPGILVPDALPNPQPFCLAHMLALLSVSIGTTLWCGCPSRLGSTPGPGSPRRKRTW